MFTKAIEIAMNFTWPIIISFRRYDDKCGSIIGTCVVVNEDGCFISASHIFQSLHALQEKHKTYLKKVELIKNIGQDSTKTRRDKDRQIAQNKLMPDEITDFTIFIGFVGISIMEEVRYLSVVDLAFGRLNGFKKEMVRQFPVFKNPKAGMSPGKSLCKLGFPFHKITPIFLPEKNSFQLPEGSVPPPYFPIEGMFTRIVNINVSGDMKYPLMFVETSSPGLKGQSGGPTFDSEGVIWAMQCQTKPYKLDFGAGSSDRKESEHLEFQYLNVGWGTHSGTIINFLSENGVKISISNP